MIANFSVDNDSKLYSLSLCSKLRSKGLVCEMDYVNNSLKPQFKLSDRVNSKYIIVIGENALSGDKVAKIKNTLTGEQQDIDLDNLDNIINYIKENK